MLTTTLWRSISLMARITNHLLPELDLSHVYLCWDRSSSTTNCYVCEMMNDKEGIYIKESAIDNMKVYGVIDRKKGFNIWFSSDVENVIHIWFKRLALEYVMLNWLKPIWSATKFEICYFWLLEIHSVTHFRLFKH
jgi:hypothetical protein